MDRDSFIAEIEACSGMMYRVAWSILRNNADCEDALQNALLRAWEKRGGTYAVVVTTLLFAALHSTVLGLPSQLISGAIMALLVIRLNSVYASMIFHTVYNGLNYGLALYANSAVDAAEAAALAGN